MLHCDPHMDLPATLFFADHRSRPRGCPTPAEASTCMHRPTAFTFHSARTDEGLKGSAGMAPTTLYLAPIYVLVLRSARASLCTVADDVLPSQSVAGPVHSQYTYRVLASLLPLALPCGFCLRVPRVTGVALAQARKRATLGKYHLALFLS